MLMILVNKIVIIHILYIFCLLINNTIGTKTFRIVRIQIVKILK